MTGKFIKSRWPKDTGERVKAMRAEGKTWDEVATSFGCSAQLIRKKAIDMGAYTPKLLRRFTPEDDAMIRADYLANADLQMTAFKIGCTYGVLRQRIFHNHRDLTNSVRSSSGTMALKRYGQDLMQHGATTAEAAANLKKKLIKAKTEAKVSALQAKIARRNKTLDEMVAAIEAGKPRDEAIFETRMLGVPLEAIAERFNITRERIRQICDKVAFDAAVHQQIDSAAPQPEMMGG